MKLSEMTSLIADPRYWRALASGVKPGIEHRHALAGIHPATVIDVGANKGQFAYLAGTLWPKARIVSFEPLPKPRARLAKLMGNRVIIHDCALGESEGTATIHLVSREDSSSLLPLGRQHDLFRMEEVGALDVPVKRLDDTIPEDLPAPILLKIDVQGFEYQVLQGAPRLLERRVRWIYVEASFVELYEGQKLAGEVIALLTSHGFHMTGQYNATHRGGQLVQADILFTSDHENRGTT